MAKPSDRDTIGGLFILILFGGPILFFLWATHNSMPKLQEWLEREEPLIAQLPKPPFGDDTVPLNANFLIAARDIESAAYGFETSDMSEHVLSSGAHVFIPRSWDQSLFPKEDVDRVDYVVLVIPTGKFLDQTLTKDLKIEHYAGNPITGYTKTGESPFPPFWNSIGKDVYIVRRSNHEVVLARSFKGDDRITGLKSLLIRTRLHGTQCEMLISDRQNVSLCPATVGAQFGAQSQ